MAYTGKQIEVKLYDVYTKDETDATIQTNSTPTAVSDKTNTSTGYFDLPSGTEAQRPSTPVEGMIRYNTELGLTENYNGAGWQGIDAPPAITNFTGIVNADTDSTITVNGTNFKSGSIIYIEGTGAGGSRALATTYVNSSQLTANTAASTTNYVGGASFNIKVANPSGLSAVLEPAGNIDRDPIWSTSSGTIATWGDKNGAQSTSVVATDPDGDSVTYALASGTLPGNTSLNTSTGAISTSDPSDVSSSTTYPFDISATSNNQIITRSFNIIVNPTPDGTTSTRAAPSGTWLYDNLGYTSDGLYWIKPTAWTGSPIQCRVWFSNSVYGRGAVLVASYASTSGFAQSSYSGGINTADLVNNNYFSSQNNSRVSVLPKDFINALVKDSTTNHTMGGIVSAQTGTTYFQYRGISEPSKGSTGLGYDMWRYMFATGAANNNTQIRISGRLNNNNDPANQIANTGWSWGNWYTYTGGRSGNDGGNNYHYMPDDETGGGEWWFRENYDDSCHQAYGRGGNDLAFVW